MTRLAIRILVVLSVVVALWLWCYLWLWPTTHFEVIHYGTLMFLVIVHVALRPLYAMLASDILFWCALGIHAVVLFVAHLAWYDQERYGWALMLYDVLVVGAGPRFPCVDGCNDWVLAHAADRSISHQRRQVLALVSAGIGGWTRAGVTWRRTIWTHARSNNYKMCMAALDATRMCGDIVLTRTDSGVTAIDADDGENITSLGEAIPSFGEAIPSFGEAIPSFEVPRQNLQRAASRISRQCAERSTNNAPEISETAPNTGVVVTNCRSTSTSDDTNALDGNDVRKVAHLVVDDRNGIAEMDGNGTHWCYAINHISTIAYVPERAGVGRTLPLTSGRFMGVWKPDSPAVYANNNTNYAVVCCDKAVYIAPLDIEPQNAHLALMVNSLDVRMDEFHAFQVGDLFVFWGYIATGEPCLWYLRAVVPEGRDKKNKRLDVRAHHRRVPCNPLPHNSVVCPKTWSIPVVCRGDHKCATTSARLVHQGHNAWAVTATRTSKLHMQQDIRVELMTLTPKTNMSKVIVSSTNAAPVCETSGVPEQNENQGNDVGKNDGGDGNDVENDTIAKHHDSVWNTARTAARTYLGHATTTIGETAQRKMAARTPTKNKTREKVAPTSVPLLFRGESWHRDYYCGLVLGDRGAIVRHISDTVFGTTQGGYKMSIELVTDYCTSA